MAAIPARAAATCSVGLSAGCITPWNAPNRNESLEQVACDDCCRLRAARRCMLRAEPLPSEGRSDCPAACSPSRTACASTASTRSSNRACSRRQTASRVSHPAASARSMEPTEPADALNSVRQRQQPHMRRVPCPSRQAWCSARQQSGTALQHDGMMLRKASRCVCGASEQASIRRLEADPHLHVAWRASRVLPCRVLHMIPSSPWKRRRTLRSLPPL